jgi:hypothetical protein
MKQIILTFLIFFCFQDTNSQALHLNNLNGGSSEYDIVNVRKIKFSDSDVLVILFSGDTISRPFNEFKNYRYNQSTLNTPIHNEIVNVFDVYPNPSQGLFEFNFSSKSLLPYKYNVCDVTGKLLFKKELGIVNGNYSGIISLSNYPAGIYFLILESGNTKNTKKLIKK